MLKKKLFETERNAEVSSHRVLNRLNDYKTVVHEKSRIQNIEMPKMRAEYETRNEDIRNSREINVLSLQDVLKILFSH